jgi:hypothetical protein
LMRKQRHSSRWQIKSLNLRPVPVRSACDLCLLESETCSRLHATKD